MMVLEAKNASFGYDGRAVVAGVSFTVNSGDYLCVAGENGAGKSTLIKGLVGLKAPMVGSVTLGGSLKSSEIGYLPQGTAAQQDFPASGYEVALSGRLNRRGIKPFFSREDHRAARENLERMSAWDLRRLCFRDLSGGQRQRVLLARALCAAKELLVLDEPVSGLDPLAAEALYREIERLNRELGIAVIMVSHDVKGALRYAGHVLHIGGERADFMTVADYLQSEIGTQFAGVKSA